MRATDIIMKKRGTFVPDANGNKTLLESTNLSKEEIKFLVDNYVAGNIPDYQVSSWLMAVYFNGMTFEETGYLTDCMLHSGNVIDLHGKENKGLKDLNSRELTALVPLVALVVILGIYPKYVLNTIDLSVQKMLVLMEQKAVNPETKEVLIKANTIGGVE